MNPVAKSEREKVSPFWMWHTAIENRNGMKKEYGVQSTNSTRCTNTPRGLPHKIGLVFRCFRSTPTSGLADVLLAICTRCIQRFIKSANIVKVAQRLYKQVQRFTKMLRRCGERQ